MRDVRVVKIMIAIKKTFARVKLLFVYKVLWTRSTMRTKLFNILWSTFRKKSNEISGIGVDGHFSLIIPIQRVLTPKTTGCRMPKNPSYRSIHWPTEDYTVGYVITVNTYKVRSTDRMRAALSYDR